MKYIPGAEPWATIVKEVIEDVGEAVDSIGKLKELSIEDKRNKVVLAINELNCPIVVFIDDIDRLPPDEVFHMIRMVKAVADFPRVAFVIAFDPEYVNDVLKDSKVANAAQYLDKIIQVRLPLPIIEQKAIENMVNEELAKLVPEVTTEYFPENKYRLGELYQSSVKFLLQSPRDVRKLFNNISMREPHVRGEVEFADLFALEVLAMKAPDIYRHLRSSPAAYTGTEADYWGLEKTSQKIAKYKSERDEVLSEQIVSNKRHIADLLESLFPQLCEDADDADEKYYSQNGRVAALDRLMIALKFGLPISEVSSNTVRTFIADGSARQDILKEISTPETMGRFVELLTLAVEQLPVSDPEHFVETLAGLAEQPLIAEMGRSQNDVLSGRRYRKIWRVLQVYLAKINHDHRLVLLHDLVTDFKKAGLGGFALEFCLRQSGFYKSDDAIAGEARWCTKAELDEVVGKWIATVTKHSTRDEVFALNGSGAIFLLLRRLDPEASTKIALSLLGSDEDVDALVKMIGESGTDSRRGRFANVTGESLDLIGGRDKFRARVQRRLESNIDADTKLRAMYNSIVTGRKFYLIDCTEG